MGAKTMSDPARVSAAESNGGPDRDRTGDTSLFRRVLYQLSYRATSITTKKQREKEPANYSRMFRKENNASISGQT